MKKFNFQFISNHAKDIVFLLLIILCVFGMAVYKSSALINNVANEPFYQEITLKSGWNIFAPSKVVISHEFSIDDTINNFDILVLDPLSPSQWNTMAGIGQTEFQPLFGYFINNKTLVDQKLKLLFKESLTPSERMFSRSLASGWNSIGFADPLLKMPSTLSGEVDRDDDTPAQITQFLADNGGFNYFFDFTDGNNDPNSFSVDTNWKRVTDENINQIKDLMDSKGYAVYVPQGVDAQHEGYQNGVEVKNLQFISPPIYIDGLQQTIASFRTIVSGDILVVNNLNFCTNGFVRNLKIYSYGVGAGFSGTQHGETINNDEGNTCFNIDFSDNPIVFQPYDLSSFGKRIYVLADIPELAVSGEPRRIRTQVIPGNNNSYSKAINGNYNFPQEEMLFEADLSDKDSLRVGLKTSVTPHSALLIAGHDYSLEGPNDPTESTMPVAVYEFETSGEKIKIEKLTVIINELDGTNFGFDTNIEDDWKAIKSLLLYDQDGVQILTKQGLPAVADMIDINPHAKAVFANLDLNIDYNRKLLLHVFVTLNDLDIINGAQSGMAFDTALSFAEGDYEVMGRISGRQYGNDDIQIDLELNNTTYYSSIMLVMGNRLMASLSPNQNNSLVKGDNEALKFILLPSIGDDTYLEKVKVNIVQENNTEFAICALKLKTEGETIASIDGSNSPLSADSQELIVGVCEGNDNCPDISKFPIDSNGSNFQIVANIGNADCSDDLLSSSFVGNASLTFRLNINGFNSGNDDIYWSDNGINGTGNMTLNWIDLREDESTNALINTLNW